MVLHPKPSHWSAKILLGAGVAPRHCGSLRHRSLPLPSSRVGWPSFGTVPGLALVHIRLGHSSSWFALAAPFDFGPFRGRTVAIIDSLALYLGLVHLASAARRVLAGRSRTADWFLAGGYPLIIAASFAWSFQASLSPDCPGIYRLMARMAAASNAVPLYASGWVKNPAEAPNLSASPLAGLQGEVGRLLPYRHGSVTLWRSQLPAENGDGGGSVRHVTRRHDIHLPGVHEGLQGGCVEQIFIPILRLLVTLHVVRGLVEISHISGALGEHQIQDTAIERRCHDVLDGRGAAFASGN